MRFHEIPIETHRENPAHTRTPGAALLVRAGYVSHTGQLLPLGQRAIARMNSLTASESGVAFFARLGLPVVAAGNEFYFPVAGGNDEVLVCAACGDAARRELACFQKSASDAENPAPLEKVLTPDCTTIESLAEFLGIPKEKTAKALMFVRSADNRFVFIVVRGDMTLSEAKLAAVVGDVRLATTEDIVASGAVPGYASPIGVQNALIVVDDLIPESANLAAGANEAGYHLRNVNYGRDYSAEIVADLVLAQEGDSCLKCGNVLQIKSGWRLAAKTEFDFERILFAMAEIHHDEKGLTLPPSAAPFDVYLMHLPGKTLDTRPAADELYEKLTAAGISVLYDDRDERAGVKFNDADLVGCPARITVGERNLPNGMVELKARTDAENRLVPLADIIVQVKKLL